MAKEYIGWGWWPGKGLGTIRSQRIRILEEENKSSDNSNYVSRIQLGKQRGIK